MMQFSPQANHVVLSSNTSEPILHSKPIDRFGAVFSTLLTLLGFTGLWISFFTFEKSASMIGFMCTILVILCIWISIPNLLMIVSVSRLMTTYGYATAAIVMAAISTSAASSCFVLFAILSSQCDGQCTSYNLMLIACGVLGISQIIVLVIAGNEFQRVPKKLQQVSSRVQYVTQEQPVNPFPYYYTPPMYNQAPSVVPISAPQAPISEFSITDSPEIKLNEFYWIDCHSVFCCLLVIIKNKAKKPSNMPKSNPAAFLSELRDSFGDIISSEEFSDKFYSCFFTLSPISERKFSDPERQKKSLQGFLSSLVKLYEDTEATSKLQWVKTKHEKMNIKEEEIRAWCKSIVITLKCNKKLSKIQLESIPKLEIGINELADFMCERKPDCCLM